MVKKRIFQGVGAAPGVGIGRVLLVDRRRVRYPKKRITGRQTEAEVQRFLDAIQTSESQLDHLRERVRESMNLRVVANEPPQQQASVGIKADHLSILEAHRMMLRDPMLVMGTRQRIQRDRLCAEWALRDTVREIKSLLDDLADNYFRERRGDIDFVGDRILRNLTGGKADLDAQVPDDALVVAHDLSPADTLQLTRSKLQGFVTDVGGRTSHTAILARALGLPAVVAAGGVSDLAANNDIIAIDGSSGEVVLHPGRAVLTRYRSIARERQRIDQELRQDLALPTETTCGQRVDLLANVEVGEEVEGIVSQGAAGVGLLRTEFMFMRGHLPNASEHRATYSHILKQLDGRVLTIRTFDLGGDKLPAHEAAPHENNPALGLRAIRYCLNHTELFRQQLRGVLEASVDGPVRLMFPMISGVSELRRARALLIEVQQELRAEGIAYDDNMQIGVMIELPAAVWVADLLAREVDFFSVGTNDLTQYILAADRDNEQVAYLYRPLHASVLRALAQVSRVAEAAGIPAGVCGEMASEPLYAPVLLGLGFRELSMHAAALPRIKSVVRSVSVERCRGVVDRMLDAGTVEELEHLLDTEIHQHLPPLLL